MTDDKKIHQQTWFAAVAAVISVVVGVFAIATGWQAMNLPRLVLSSDLDEMERAMINRYATNADFAIASRALILEIAIAQLQANLGSLQGDKASITDAKALRLVEAAEKLLYENIGRFQKQLDNLSVERDRLLRGKGGAVRDRPDVPTLALERDRLGRLHHTVNWMRS